MAAVWILLGLATLYVLLMEVHAARRDRRFRRDAAEFERQVEALRRASIEQRRSEDEAA